MAAERLSSTKELSDLKSRLVVANREIARLEKVAGRDSAVGQSRNNRDNSTRGNSVAPKKNWKRQCEMAQTKILLLEGEKRDAEASAREAHASVDQIEQGVREIQSRSSTPFAVGGSAKFLCSQTLLNTLSSLSNLFEVPGARTHRPHDPGFVVGVTGFASSSAITVTSTAHQLLSVDRCGTLLLDAVGFATQSSAAVNLAAAADCVREAALESISHEAFGVWVKEFISGLAGVGAGGGKETMVRMIFALARVRGYYWGRCLPNTAALARGQHLDATGDNILSWICRQVRFDTDLERCLPKDEARVPAVASELQKAVRRLLHSASSRLGKHRKQCHRFIGETDLSFDDLLHLSPLALDRGDDHAMWTDAHLGISLRSLIMLVWPTGYWDILEDLRVENGPVLGIMSFGAFLRQQRQLIATTHNHTRPPGATSLTVGQDVMLTRRGVRRVTKHVRVHYSSGRGIDDSFDLGEVCRTYSPDGATVVAGHRGKGVNYVSTWLLTCRFGRVDLDTAVMRAAAAVRRTVRTGSSTSGNAKSKRRKQQR
jgi:hypothetical protein